MKRAVRLIVFVVLVFGAIVVARLPASWVAPGRSGTVGCSDVDGTIWSGTCTGLTFERQPIGDLTWEVHAARLLAGRLEATVALALPSGSAQATIETGLDKIVTARSVKADLPIEPALVPQVPADLRGTLHADLSLVRLEGRVIKVLQGRLEAHDLVQGTRDAATPLGSFSLDFPAAAGGEPVGQLRDLGGPLQVEGSLKLTPEPGFDLQGLVKARDTASPELAREIQFLGSPDARGMRPFALAATF